MDGLLTERDLGGSRIPSVPDAPGGTSASSAGQAIPTSSPARGARVQSLAAADLERGPSSASAVVQSGGLKDVKNAASLNSLPRTVLLRGCPHFQRQIAPDSLYFGPGERAVHFCTTVAGVEYAQDPAEQHWFNDDDPGWPGEDMEGS